MTITDYFDPHNLEHIKAYANLCVTGLWPEGFVSEDIEFNSGWQFHIMNKLAESWVEHKLFNR